MKIKECFDKLNKPDKIKLISNNLISFSDINYIIFLDFIKFQPISKNFYFDQKSRPYTRKLMTLRETLEYNPDFLL